MRVVGASESELDCEGCGLRLRSAGGAKNMVTSKDRADWIETVQMFSKAEKRKDGRSPDFPERARSPVTFLVSSRRGALVK